jgi:hypothetical protein
MRKTLIAIAIAAGLCTGPPAMATPLQDQVIQAAVLVHRATVLCPQFIFKTDANYDRLMRGARKLYGDAAVDGGIQRVTKIIDDMLVSGGKETFCDQAVNLDAAMSELAH